MTLCNTKGHRVPFRMDPAFRVFMSSDATLCGPGAGPPRLGTNAREVRGKLAQLAPLPLVHETCPPFIPDQVPSVESGRYCERPSCGILWDAKCLVGVSSPIATVS
jgi:hypothetical protein